MNTNRTARRNRTNKTNVAVVPTVEPTIPAIVEPTIPAAPAIVEPTIPAVLTLADVIPADTLGTFSAVPAWLYPMRDAIRSIATMPTKTVSERETVRASYVTLMSASTGITGEPVGKHTGRFTGCAVFETQNAIYMACALANVAVNDGHIVAVWRGELPFAKCDYIGHAYDRGYPTSTLSLYARGGHNGGTIPGMRVAVGEWQRRGRKPLVSA